MKKTIAAASLAMLLAVGMILIIPFQASAAMTYTMTAFQSLGDKFASGEITGQLTSGQNSITPNYSFCIDNAADLNQGIQYNASLISIAGNAGLLESAYLINKYVPKNSALSDINLGVALQWAIWMSLGQGSPLTDTGVMNPTLASKYSTIYGSAQGYLAEAQNAYDHGQLAQFAGTYKELQLQGSQSLLLVQDTTPTPIPAAAWLLGSGLMGLIGLKRRKG